jgi:hypothetical protein
MIKTLRFLTIILVLIMAPWSGVFAQDEMSEEMPADMPCEEVAPEEPYDSIADYVVEYEMHEGMFTYYTDPVSGRALIKIKPEQLGTMYFISTSLTRGNDDPNFSAPMMWGASPVIMQRNAGAIEFIRPNFSYTTAEGEPVATLIDNNAGNLIMGRSYIEAENEDGTVVFDFPTMLLAVTGMELWGLPIDYESAVIGNIKGFPENDEVDARIGISLDMMTFDDIMFHFSIHMPPPEGYVPRMSDERVGFFEDMNIRYASDTEQSETRYVRYINRFRLEKADPDAEMSEPVEPIVFWIENTVPEEYRDSIRDGILLWNDAFERIGYRDAIVVKQQPDDADWDPADTRYNTVRWFFSPNSNYAIGPSNSDPRTGEVFDADVGISADMMRSAFRNFDFEVDPLLMGSAGNFPPGWPDILMRQIDPETVDEYLNREYGEDNRFLPGPAGGEKYECHYAEMSAMEAARASAVLQERGMEPGGPEEQEFVHQYVVGLVAHEIGHVIGLRHNFSASTATPFWKLNNSRWTDDHGMSGSVMDYDTANVAPEGALQGDYWQTSLGDYDYWAIEYGYSYTGAETPNDELDALDEIASRSPHRGHRYGTDEDGAGWTFAMDPDTITWTLGHSLVDFYDSRLQVSNELIENAIPHFGTDGARPNEIRIAFLNGFYDYIMAANNVSRLIGGVRAYRDHIGDEAGEDDYGTEVDYSAHISMVPVSAEEQRRALWFLDTHIWNSDNFDYDDEILNYLMADRRITFSGWTTLMGQRDFDLSSYVLMAQALPFVWIYDPVVLQRIQNNEMRMDEGEDVFTLPELFETVRGSAWKELESGENIDGFRRNLQRAHLSFISYMYLASVGGTPPDAVALARADLVYIQGRIQSILSGDAVVGMDSMTIAHLEDVNASIEQVLGADTFRLY